MAVLELEVGMCPDRRTHGRRRAMGATGDAQRREGVGEVGNGNPEGWTDFGVHEATSGARPVGSVQQGIQRRRRRLRVGVESGQRPRGALEATPVELVVGSH